MSVFTAIGYQPPSDHKRASQCSGFLATFVRNPLSRFVSAFEFLRDPKWNQRAIPERTTFRDFVLSRSFEAADTLFFKPMTYWLDAPVGFIGRFESLHEDYVRLCTLIGLKQPVELPRMHVWGGDWNSFYDEETRAVVCDAYADDIVRFGYGA